MDADALAFEVGRSDGMGRGEKRNAPREHGGGIVGDQILERGHFQLQGVERAVHLSVDSPRIGRKVGGREWLGPEGWVAGRRGERKVQLRCSLAKQGGRVQIERGMFGHGRRYRVLGEQRRRQTLLGRIRSARDRLKEACQLA